MATLADGCARRKPMTVALNCFPDHTVPDVTTGRVGATGEKARTPVGTGATCLMPRFVILEHDHPQLHWDLMLEAGPVLRTWRLTAPPVHGEAIAAAAVFDHRLLYLDYEGPIAGGRGRVVRWDRGTFLAQIQTESLIIAQLQGERLIGIMRLEHVEKNAWQFSMKVENEPEA